MESDHKRKPKYANMIVNVIKIKIITKLYPVFVIDVEVNILMECVIDVIDKSSVHNINIVGLHRYIVVISLLLAGIGLVRY